MASKHLYNPVESGSLSLGAAGSQVVSSSAAVPETGVFMAITVLADATFSALTPEDPLFPSETSLSFQIPAGITIYGRWTAFTLSGGSVIAYNG